MHLARTAAPYRKDEQVLQVRVAAEGAVVEDAHIHKHSNHGNVQ
jgi:hypothetical protein